MKIKNLKALVLLLLLIGSMQKSDAVPRVKTALAVGLGLAGLIYVAWRYLGHSEHQRSMSMVEEHEDGSSGSDERSEGIPGGEEEEDPIDVRSSSASAGAIGAVRADLFSLIAGPLAEGDFDLARVIVAEKEQEGYDVDACNNCREFINDSAREAQQVPEDEFVGFGGAEAGPADARAGARDAARVDLYDLIARSLAEENFDQARAIIEQKKREGCDAGECARLLGLIDSSEQQVRCEQKKAEENEHVRKLMDEQDAAYDRALETAKAKERVDATVRDFEQGIERLEQNFFAKKELVRRADFAGVGGDLQLLKERGELSLEQSESLEQKLEECIERLLARNVTDERLQRQIDGLFNQALPGYKECCRNPKQQTAARAREALNAVLDVTPKADRRYRQTLLYLNQIK